MMVCYNEICHKVNIVTNLLLVPVGEMFKAEE